MHYFDNNATTFVYDEKVFQEMNDWINCGNPSNNLHKLGSSAKNKIECCRFEIATILKVPTKYIYFTSGATESNNIIIQGIINFYLRKKEKKKYTIIASAIEHVSILNVLQQFEDVLDIIYIKPNSDGIIDPQNIENSIKNAKYSVILVTVMHINNESGCIMDIVKIGKICKKYDIFFHSDVTQSIGKYDVYPLEWNIDAISFSGHKFHAPKGIGAMYLNTDKNIKLCYGGHQENGIRPGTENVAFISAMTSALIISKCDRINKNNKLKKYKKFIIDSLNRYLNIEIIGKNTSINTILIILKDIKCNKTMLKILSDKNIYLSVGSACQTSQFVTSHVLDSMGISEKEQKKVVRISLSDYTTDIDCAILVGTLICEFDKFTHNKN